GFAKLVQMRADALLVATDAFFFTRAPQLVVLAARHAIPTVYFRREFAAAGGLMSYAANPNESYRLLGVYAARLLNAEKPPHDPTVEEVRAGDQRQHSRGGGTGNSPGAARPRRGGDRMMWGSYKINLPRRNFLHLAAGAAALPAASRIAWAQAYPSRPVRLIV